MNRIMLRPAAGILLRPYHSRLLSRDFEFYGEYSWGFVTTTKNFFTGNTASFPSRSNSLAAAQSTRGKSHVAPSKMNKDPKEQKAEAKRRAEQKPPGSEWQTEKTAIKGDATEASKKAEDTKKSGDLKNAKAKLNESTYGKD